MINLEEYLLDDNLEYHIFDGVISISDLVQLKYNLNNYIEDIKYKDSNIKGVSTLIIEEFELKPRELLKYQFPNFIDLVSDIKCDIPLLWKFNIEHCNYCNDEEMVDQFNECYKCYEDLNERSYINLLYNNNKSTLILRNDKYHTRTIIISYTGYKLTDDENKRLYNSEIMYYPYIYNNCCRRIIV